ncbi:MAG: hypothetical protein JWO05_758 [Gemmatimonadetes bacterium]|nr:hypothetical protein [Gemmatimonadota bacterium]
MVLSACSRPVPSPLDAIVTRLSTGKHEADCHGRGFHGELPQADFDYCEWTARTGETLTGNKLKRQVIAVQWTRQAADSLQLHTFVDSLTAALEPQRYSVYVCPYQEWARGHGGGARWESSTEYIVMHWYFGQGHRAQVNVSWMLRPQFQSVRC